jgi:hypothetical protein
MQQKRSKIGSGGDGFDERWTVNDVDRYLRITLGMRDGDALFEQQEKFERGRLVLHWREIDGPNAGQEGNIPRSVWGRQLRLARDPAPGAVDFATARTRDRSPKQDEVFVQELTASVPRGKQKLTVSMRDVYAAWSESQPSTNNTSAATRKRTDADFAALTPRVRLTVQALDVLEEQGIVIGGMPKTELRTQAEKQAQDMSPSATVSTRTLSDAEAYRRQHPK